MFEKRNNFTQQEKKITVIKIIEHLEVNSYYDGTTPLPDAPFNLP